jgi:hypothetical protein
MIVIEGVLASQWIVMHTGRWLETACHVPFFKQVFVHHVSVCGLLNWVLNASAHWRVGGVASLSSSLWQQLGNPMPPIFHFLTISSVCTGRCDDCIMALEHAGMHYESGATLWMWVTKCRPGSCSFSFKYLSSVGWVLESAPNLCLLSCGS